MKLRFSRSSLNLIIFTCIILIGWASIDANINKQHTEDSRKTEIIVLPALSELQQRAASDNNGLQQQAASMLEQAFQGFDIIGKWQTRLQEEASGWLNQQQLHAQDALQKNLSPLIDDKIQQQLATELNKAVSTQLETALAQQNAALTVQLQRQRAVKIFGRYRSIFVHWISQEELTRAIHNVSVVVHVERPVTSIDGLARGERRFETEKTLTRNRKVKRVQ